VELKAYSIRDAAAEAFGLPFFKRSHGEAERDFTRSVNDEKSVARKNPEHFDLYYLGTYDDGTGVVRSLDTPQHILKAVAVLEK